MLEAIAAQDLAHIGAQLQNDLQLAAQALGIEVDLPIALLKDYGAIGACLSGSGAASFGLWETLEKARFAEAAIRNDARLPPGFGVFCAPLIESGCARADLEWERSG